MEHNQNSTTENLVEKIKEYLTEHPLPNNTMAEEEQDNYGISNLEYGIKCLVCKKAKSDFGFIVQVRQKKTELSIFTTTESFFDLQNIHSIRFMQNSDMRLEKDNEKYKSDVVNLATPKMNLFLAFKNQEKLLLFLRECLALLNVFFEEDVFERRIWYSLDKDNNGFLDKAEFKKFCKDFLRNKHWKAKFEEFDLNHDNKISYEEFTNFVESFYPQYEYAKIISRLSESNSKTNLNFFEIKRFLNEIEKENLSDKEIAEIILENKLVPTNDSKKEYQERKNEVDEFFKNNLNKQFIDKDELTSKLSLTDKEFKKLIESKTLGILDKSKIHKKLEDYRPLNDFFINSSHNTYIKGHQLYGECSANQYKLAMEYGCRLVELDCYNGDGHEIKVTHGYTLTGNVKLTHIYQILSENGFFKSNYPLILSVENHLDKTYQKYMADASKNILKNLFILPKKPTGELPKLREMKNKFIIKCGGSRLENPNRKELTPRSKINYEPDEEELKRANPIRLVDQENFSNDINDDEYVPEKPQGLRAVQKNSNSKEDEALEAQENEPEKEYGQDLLDLRGLIGTKFHIDKIEAENYQTHEFVTLKDTVFKSYWSKDKEKEREKVTRFSYDCLLKAYPTHFSSENYNPLKVWMVGGQVAALNIQSLDEDYTMINKIFFMQNEGCGYVLKPKKLLPESFEFKKYTEKEGTLKITIHNLLEEVELIEKAGKEVSKKCEKKLEVKLYGSPKDEENGTFVTPVEGTFIQHIIKIPTHVFNIYETDLSCIVIKLLYDGEVIGRTAIPFCMMRPGIRRVSLYDLNQIEAQTTAIIAEFEMNFNMQY